LNGTAIAGAKDTSFIALVAGNYTLQNTAGGSSEIWAIGYNANGMFGDNTNANNPLIQQANVLTTVKQMSSGSRFMAAVLNSGAVYTWGSNSSGQLGDGTFTNSNVPTLVSGVANVKTIATTKESVLAVTNTGTTFVWGNNSFGQLSTGNTSIVNFPMNNAALTNVDTAVGGADHAQIGKAVVTNVAAKATGRSVPLKARVDEDAV
jgi:alpha-tubulin suppressor-like RCC1 family protein